MADAKISELTAIDAVTGVDLLAVVDDPAGTPVTKKATATQLKTFINTPGGSNTQVQFNDGGAFAGDSGFTFNKTTKALTLTGSQTIDPADNTSALAVTGYSLTGSNAQSLIDLAGTWNTTGTPTALKLNVTDTASNAASLLMDLQTNTGGAPTSRLKVDKTGNVTATNYFLGPGVQTSVVNATSTLTTNGSLLFGTSNDLILTRRGAANLRLGAADAAGSAISISSVASNQLTLASNHGLSNGAAVQITFTAGGAVPSGTSVNPTYYARSISAAVLELYGTYDQALNTASTTGRVAVTTAGTTAFVNRATPFQTLSVQSFTGTDIPGQPFVITGSQGTGTGRGGDIIFQVAPAGTTGTAQNALATALTIAGNRNVQFFGSVTLDTGNLDVGISGSGTTTTRGLRLNVGTAISFSDGAQYYPIINLDAADTLALRNGNNGQTFRLYGRFTDITNNFERFFINAPTTSGAAVQLGTQKGATTGAARALEFQTDGTTRLTIAATTGNITTTGSVTTEAPTGGTAAAWRLGTVATVSPTSPNRTIEVDIGGTIYYISAKTTND